jgi:hypothetical protein
LQTCRGQKLLFQKHHENAAVLERVFDPMLTLPSGHWQARIARLERLLASIVRSQSTDAELAPIEESSLPPTPQSGRGDDDDDRGECASDDNNAENVPPSANNTPRKAAPDACAARDTGAVGSSNEQQRDRSETRETTLFEVTLNKKEGAPGGPKALGMMLGGGHAGKPVYVYVTLSSLASFPAPVPPTTAHENQPHASTSDCAKIFERASGAIK